MTTRTLALLLAATLTAAPTLAYAEPPPDDYVVVGNETCMEIAVKVLGDRRLLPELHKLNPQLGALPHVLRAGQVLKVPHVEEGPDARLTGKTGDVRVRKPADSVWDRAKRGMDLFRAWRVGAEERASAEVTFADTQRLYLRANTVVIIYGPERRRARLDAPEAVLERGTLRTRLGELTGKPLKITTPSAEAEVGKGSAVVGVDDAGQSMVANHDGGAIALKGRAGGKVAVRAGMGTRVAVGKKPEKPRPLPPAPSWTSTAPLGFVAVGGSATITAAWTPEPRAVSYRFELWRGDALVAGAEVPGTVTTFELHGAPPGDYRVQVASLDRDRLEGKAGAPLAVTVRGVTLVPPGAEAPPPAAAATDEDSIAAAAAPPVPVVARGARVVTDGITCGVDGAAPAAVTVLGTAGTIALSCTGPDGAALAPVTIAVADVALAATADGGAVTVDAGGRAELVVGMRADAALGDAWQLEPSVGLTVDSVRRTADGLTATLHAAPDAPTSGTVRVVDAVTQRSLGELAITIVARVETPVIPEQPAPIRRAGAPRWTVSAFAGGLYLPTGDADGTELGNAALPADIVDSGPALGVRGAHWFTRDLFVEAEVAVVPTRFAGDDRRALVLGGHAHVGVRLIDRGNYELRALAGGGAFALTSDSPDVDDDLDPGVGWGLTGVAGLSRDLRLRLDGRQQVVADRHDGVTSVLGASLGLELVLGR